MRVSVHKRKLQLWAKRRERDLWNLSHTHQSFLSTRLCNLLLSQKMSWDSYLDNLVAQSKDAAGTAHVDRACIIGIDGGAAWTTEGHANALKVSFGV